MITCPLAIVTASALCVLHFEIFSCKPTSNTSPIQRRNETRKGLVRKIHEVAHITVISQKYPGGTE
jgi:hypothetical protein